jgi:hypothetical protein
MPGTLSKPSRRKTERRYGFPQHALLPNRRSELNRYFVAKQTIIKLDVISLCVNMHALSSYINNMIGKGITFRVMAILP